MKLNNRGFAISSILYIILIIAVILVSLTLTILTSRKLIIEKTKEETLNKIYNRYELTYREVLKTLKEEIISYATENNITKESIKIGDFSTSISEEITNGYKLDTKYLTVISNNSNYDVYLGKKETITGNNKEVKDLVDIIDYKIEGNSYQDLSSGSPSPSDPIEVYSVGDKITDDTDSNYGKYNIPIRTGGKNLLDNTSLLASDTSHAKWEITETGFKQIKTSTGGYVATVIYDITDIVKPNTKYYFHRDVDKNYVPTNSTQKSNSGALSLHVDGSRIAIMYPTTTDNSVIMPESFESVQIKTWTVVPDAFTENFDSNTEYYLEWSNLYMGTEEYTEYVPYVKPYTTNIYLDNPLRKVGTKIDTMGLSSSNIKRNVGISIPKSTNDFWYSNQGIATNNLYRSMLGFKDASNYMVSGSNIPGYSNVLPSNKQRWNKWTEEQVHFGQANNAIYLIFNEEKATLGDVYDYLSSDGTVEPYFIYQLNSEKTEEVSLPKINTSIGTQTISVDTDIEPSNVEFTVIKKIKQL